MSFELTITGTQAGSEVVEVAIEAEPAGSWTLALELEVQDCATSPAGHLRRA